VRDCPVDLETVCSEISSLREESQQIKELMKLEEYYSRKVVDHLKQIMMKEKTSIPINVATVPTNDPLVCDASLTPEGIVCLLSKQGKVLHRKPLEKFQSERFLKIVEEILPQVKYLVNNLQEEPSESLTTIERMSMELRKIVRGENVAIE
jgi:hypothetical protein